MDGLSVGRKLTVDGKERDTRTPDPIEVFLSSKIILAVVRRYGTMDGRTIRTVRRRRLSIDEKEHENTRTRRERRDQSPLIFVLHRFFLEAFLFIISRSCLGAAGGFFRLFL
jgi:hypothetical protein